MSYIFRAYLGLNSPNQSNLSSDVEAREFWIAEEAEAMFPHGCTTYDAVGIWAGDQERTVIVEVISDNTRSEAQLAKLAGRYKDFAQQECVMITKQEVDCFMV